MISVNGPERHLTYSSSLSPLLLMLWRHLSYREWQNLAVDCRSVQQVAERMAVSLECRSKNRRSNVDVHARKNMSAYMFSVLVTKPVSHLFVKWDYCTGFTHWRPAHYWEDKCWNQTLRCMFWDEKLRRVFKGNLPLRERMSVWFWCSNVEHKDRKWLGKAVKAEPVSK